MFVLPKMPVPTVDEPQAPKVRVVPKLVPDSSSVAPEMWLLEHNAMARMQVWVRQSDERLIAKLLAARVSFGTDEVVLLTVRPGVHGAPVLVLDAVGYRPYLKLPNLFVPVGTQLRPLLRRDTARNHYAADPERLVWLSQTRDGLVAADIPRAALRPLADGVQYTVPPAVRADVTL